ncbi:MAG: hypothetical protein ACT4PZ_07135 [Panacagrimonas sp.]
MTPAVITSSPELERLIQPYAHTFPRPSDFLGYRSHCLRMLNAILYVSADEPHRREICDIALAFHDVTVFPQRTLDYLGSSAALAVEHLKSIGREEWAEPVRLMIEMHHKITPYRGAYANLVEAMRQADWLDVSFGLVSFGIPRDWLREVRGALPLHTFYPRALFPVIGSYMVRHPQSPLPNFRW